MSPPLAYTFHHRGKEGKNEREREKGDFHGAQNSPKIQPEEREREIYLYEHIYVCCMCMAIHSQNQSPLTTHSYNKKEPPFMLCAVFG